MRAPGREHLSEASNLAHEALDAQYDLDAEARALEQGRGSLEAVRDAERRLDRASRAARRAQGSPH